MKKTPGHISSLTKKVIDRVSGRSTHPDSQPQEPRRLITESLEPRVLYSGSPVPAPDPPAADFGSASVRQGIPLPSNAVSPDSFAILPPQGFLEVTGTRVPLTADEFSSFVSLAHPSHHHASDTPIEVADSGHASDLPQSFLLSHLSEINSTKFGWSVFFFTPDTTDTFSSRSESAATFGTAPHDLFKAIGAEVLLDPSLLVAAPSAPSNADCTFFATVAVAVLGSVGRSTSSSPGTGHPRASSASPSAPLSTRLFGSRTASDLCSTTAPHTLTIPASPGAAATIADPAPSQRPTRRSTFPTVALTTSRHIAFTPPHPPLSDAADAHSLPNPTSSIYLGGYNRDQDSRESDRLFIDVEGFDFTVLPTGTHSNVVQSAHPLVFATLETTAKPASGKPALQKHRQFAPSLSKPVTGTSFAGHSFSLEVWFTAPSTPDVSSLLFKIDDEFGLPRALSASLKGSKLVIAHRTADFRYRNHCFTIPNAVSEPGALHHLVIVRKNSDVSLFLDTTDVTPLQNQISGMTIFGGSVSFRRSGKKAAPSPYATVSEFALFGYDLDPYTISSHYHSRFAQAFTRPRKTKPEPIATDSPKVFISRGGLFSHSSKAFGGRKKARLKLSDLDLSVTPLPSAPSAPIFGPLQSVLDRVPREFLDTGSPVADLGFFISNRPAGADAEIRSLNWDVTESILAHFGVTYQPDPTSTGHFSRSLFISDESSDTTPLGVVASVDESGKISSVTPLEFAPGSASTHSSADLLAALKYLPSSPAGLSPSSGSSESATEDGLHLTKMSSVQSDVFGIRDH